MALDLRGEVNLAGTWTDATTLLYQRNPVSVTRGRQNESSTMQPSQATFTANNRDGRWTVRNPAGAWYGQLVQNTQFRLSVPASVAGLPNYLRLETDTVSYASCPDSAGLQITSGTLSVRADCKITDWTGNHILVAKEGATANGWALYTNGNGTVAFNHYDSGAVFRVSQSTLPVPYFASRIAIRADYNISAQTITFFTAPNMAGSWTQLGTVLTTGATTQAAAAGQAVQAGNGQSNTLGMYGEIYEVQVLSAGVLKANPVFTAQTAGVSSFADAQSNTWTLTGTAGISDRLYRFGGELSSLPKASDPSQHDLYSDATASGISQRMQQQQSPVASALTRAYLRLPASLQLQGYWSCEEAAGSGQLASGTTGGIPGTAGPAVQLASNSVFACSLPIPVLNGGQMAFQVAATGVTWTGNVVRFLFSVPAADDPGVNSLVCRIQTQGTVARLDLLYTTGGNLTLIGYDAGGTQLFTSGAQAFGLPALAQCRVSIELTGGTNYALWVLNPGVSATGVHPAFSHTAGAVTAVQFGGGGLITSAVGQVSVQAVSDTINDLSQPLAAWNGETAGNRFSRLCGEEGIACRITGPPDISQPMGNQTEQTVLQLLQECEATDQGMMLEPRQVAGLGYITLAGLYNQPAAATANYTASAVAAGFAATSDDQLIVNDVTFTAADGSASRQILATGPQSIAAVGRIDTTVTGNPQTDAVLGSLANWYLHVRTVNDDRYGTIPFQMARASTPQAAGTLDIGQYLQLTNTPTWVPPGPVKQLVAGYTETFMPQPLWGISVNAIPETPYEVGIVGDSILGRADTDGSVLQAGISSGAASMTVTSLSPALPLWTQAGGDFPFDVQVNYGEVMTVSAIGAPVQQNGATAASISANPGRIAVTPLNTGSWIYGAVIREGAAVAFTANASTTFSQNTTDATNSNTYGTFRSTATTTASTPVTVGASAPAAACQIAAAEIISAGTLAEDGSSPAAVSSTAAATVTTAAFTPPANSLLVAMAAGNNTSGAVTRAVTGGGLTWYQAASDSLELTNVWIAYVPAGGAPGMTVTAASSGANVNNGIALTVKVLTSAAGLPAQVFTISARGVNGVAVAHSALEDIRLAHPMIVSL